MSDEMSEEMLRLEFPVGVEIVNFADHITQEIYGESIEEVDYCPLDRSCRGVDEAQESEIGSPQN